MAEEQFDFGAFVTRLKRLPVEARRAEVHEELNRIRRMVIRENTGRFEQQIQLRRLDRLERFLGGEDVTGELTPTERQAYAVLAAAAPSERLGEGTERRESRRIQMKTRVRVRAEAGSSDEIVEPQNVSRGGFGFLSDARYEMHEAVWTTMHYQPGSGEMETRGIIVRAAPLPDGRILSYGVKFLPD